MSLSVTGASNASAVLQTLLTQTATQSASGPDQAHSTHQHTGVNTSTPSVSTSAAMETSASFAAIDGANQALTTADAADAAGQSVMDLLQQMRTLAGQAADPSTPAGEKAALHRQFQANAGQIAPILAAATVNGANLVDGSLESPLKVSFGDGSMTSLTPVDLSPGGSTLGASTQASLATTDGAASALAALGGAIATAGAGLSTLQTQADQISAHAGVVQTLGQALASPDQDGGDSVRLMALQLSQQLSTQPSAIANHSPQSILSLFRS